MKTHLNVKGKIVHWSYLILFLMLFSLHANAETVKTDVEQQNEVVSGTIRSSIDGKPLAGVSVLIKGTNTATSSNASGQYSINLTGNKQTLVFSYVGYTPLEVSVNSRKVIDVTLESSEGILGDVVVTALGIKREERSLGYSVGTVKGEDLNRVVNENVLSAISGKVAGVSVSSTGGTGSSVSMVIRGATSLSNDNQPLFVVDGVPIANSLNNVGEMGRDNKVDYGNAISSINPDDIADISILKGPSAAALYGSRAGNGVVLITTKSGSGVSKMTVSVNSNTVFDKPYKFLDMHSKFATGIATFTPDKNPYPGGILVIDEGSAAGSGPELDKGYKAIQWNSPLGTDGKRIPTDLVSYPNNVKNFVQTGITSTNGMSIANNTELMNYRISYANMSNRGIIPGSDLFRNSLNLNSNLKLHEKFRVGTMLDFSRNNSNNRPATNRGANPLQWAYAVSPHIDIRDLKDYWVPGQEGIQQFSQNQKNYNNPYFLAHELSNAFTRDRVFGNVRADYDITPELSFMARYSLDTYREERENKIANSYTADANGGYGITNLSRQEQNVDVLATYKKRLRDLNISVSGGANTRYQNNTDVVSQTKSRTGLVIPGLYTLSNIAPTSLQYSSYLSQKSVNSVYGMANFGYKDMLYLDVTARNDWSSTLPKSNRSYFYPSASLSVLLDGMFNMSEHINMFKLRGGVAKVGNDTSPYSLLNTLGNAGSWGGITRLSQSGFLLLPDLKPEISTSYEGGVDITALSNRLRFQGTYYQVENENQIIPTKLPGSSGFTSKNINAGLFVSKGLELSIGGTPIRGEDWNWDISLNWSRNRTTITELSEGLEFYELWDDAKGRARTFVGEQIGNLYDAELVTVKDKNSPYFGYPILDDDGSWQDIKSANSRSKIGNFNPDFSMGMQTSVSYKNFSFNMALDMRLGGNFVSQTYRYGESDLKSQRLLDQLIHPNGLSGQALRDYLVNNDLVIQRGNHFPMVGGPTADYGGFPFEFGGQTYPFGVFNPGVFATYDSAGEITGYTENLGGAGTMYIPYSDNYPWSFMRASTFDASFIKLREISVGYNLPSRLVQRLGMQNANIALFSRNILLWTKAKIAIDPEMAFQAEGGGGQAGTQFRQGIERYNVNPWVMPIGLKLGVTF